MGTIVAIAYFRHCSKKAASPPALPPRLVHFSPPRQDKKGVTKPLFRKKGGRQFSSSMRLNLSEQFRQCETPVSPIFGTPTRQPAREEPVNPFAAPSPVVHRVFVDETLSPEVLNMIKPFQGSSTDDARDWVLSIEDVGRAQGWRVQTHRRAAVAKLSGGAYDWHVVDGCSLPLWEGWRVAFLKMFVKELTLEQWTHLVENRVRLPFETGLEYSLAKRRICVKCPVPLTPIQVIQRMVFGLNSPAYKAAVLSSNPTSVESYFDLIRRLDEASLGEIEDRNASRGGLASDSLVPEVGASSLNSFMESMVKEITLRLPKDLSQPPPTSYKKSPQGCATCGLTGHVSWHCPDTRGSTGTVPKASSNAGNYRADS